LFRLGDFYEMFLEDANWGPAPQRGVDQARDDSHVRHSVPCRNGYIARLLSQAAGRICDQMEDPDPTTVKREVTQIFARHAL